MTKPQELQSGDDVSIDRDLLSDVVFRVSDVQVKDIGIAEVVVVTLVSDSKSVGIYDYTLTGTVGVDSFALLSMAGEKDFQVTPDDITAE